MAISIGDNAKMQSMIWLMRHATAGPTTDAKDDDKRPLDPEGVKQATAAGIALKRLKTPIQYCMSSPLTRALQTAELTCEALGLTVHVRDALAGGPLDVDALTKGFGNCLLVGHAPAVSLVIYERTGAQCQLAKGGLAQLHEGELWSLLNPSTAFIMAGMLDEFQDPQEVDTRADDDITERIERTERQMYGLASPSWRLGAGSL